MGQHVNKSKYVVSYTKPGSDKRHTSAKLLLGKKVPLEWYRYPVAQDVAMKLARSTTEGMRKYVQIEKYSYIITERELVVPPFTWHNELKFFVPGGEEEDFFAEPVF